MEFVCGFCSTRGCAAIWRKARRNGLCHECLRNDAASQVLLYIMIWLAVYCRQLVCVLQEPNYELCSTRACAAVWRKARRDGLCRACLRDDEIKQVLYQFVPRAHPFNWFCYLQETKYELCETRGCAALVRKACRDGLCN